MRRRENTGRIRYRNALQHAKRTAFIARRAIEFRLGVDMADMLEDMTLVEAPSRWVNDVCTMSGIDYEVISDGEVVHEGDNYAESYIGDYVDKLERFVESYPIDYPFNDSEDVTALSLREFEASKGLACYSEESNPNLLYYSDNLTGSHVNDGVVTGWTTEGCVTYTGEEWNVDNCLHILDNDDIDDNSDGIPDARLDPTDESSVVADLIADQGVSDGSGGETYFSRPIHATSSGYVEQRYEDLDHGLYMLEYWVKVATNGSTTVPYNVEILDREETVLNFDSSDPPVDWQLNRIFFEVDRDQETIIRVHPSLNDCLVVDQAETCTDVCVQPDPNCGLGAIWMTDFFLWKVPSHVCNSVETCEGLADLTTDYTRTSDTREIPQACEHPTEFDFRGQWSRRCVDSSGNECYIENEAGCRCYREINFKISLDEVENCEMFQEAFFATNNYNYRHNRLAVNLQGSNILHCGDDAPSSCYSNGTLQFSLEHDGDYLPIRNWTGDTVHFDMPLGRVQHGRALAAEVVPTNPLSSNQRNMFQDYWREELRGRPLQGTYKLRIWENSAFRWENVEDIQLILDYRYWTRFGQ